MLKDSRVIKIVQERNINELKISENEILEKIIKVLEENEYSLETLSICLTVFDGGYFNGYNYQTNEFQKIKNNVIREMVRILQFI